MDLGKIGQASLIYDRIKKVELQIAELEALGRELSNGAPLHIHLSCEAPGGMIAGNSDDSTLGLMPTRFTGIFELLDERAGRGRRPAAPPKICVQDLLEDTLGLNLLGALKREKVAQLDRLVNQLQALGL